MKKDRLKVLVADDHRLVLDGFVRVLNEIDAVTEVLTACSGTDAFDLVLLHKDIDLVITDLEMPEMGGIELLRKLKAHAPEIKVLVLTMHNSAALIREVIKLDADGYVLKSADSAELALAIHSLVAGRKYFAQNVTLELATETRGEKRNVLHQLTDREKQILALVAQGHSNKAIADRLFISVKTVDSHRTNLMQKLDIHNTAGLTRLAIQAGLV